MSGITEYKVLHPEVYRIMDAFLLCFSIESRANFENVPHVSLSFRIVRVELPDEIHRKTVVRGDTKRFNLDAFYPSRLQM